LLFYQNTFVSKLRTFTNFIPSSCHDGSGPGRAFPDDPDDEADDLSGAELFAFLTGLRSSGPESESESVDSFLGRFFSGFGILVELKR
jgi:hypothetical protein